MSPVLHPSPFGQAQTIVVKVGSAVLTTGGAIDLDIMNSICSEIAGLMKSGRKIILVTSGAVAAGRGMLGVTGKPKTIAVKQALAAVGQSQIMHIYADIFAQHGIVVGQMLLSRGDMEDRRRYLNARYTLEELLSRKCLPIINENDTVTIDELRFGDNDGLAALVAVKMQAEALILLSDVDGVFDDNPKTNPNAKLIPIMDKITPALVEQLCPNKPGSSVGSGGMYSKLIAAKVATASRVCVCIAHGRKHSQISSIIGGDFVGTFFPPSSGTHSRRHQWILTSKSAASRRLHVDDGARNALTSMHKSLLPAGIVRVDGSFNPGNVVEIIDSTGRPVARGIVNYSAPELRRIMGHKTADIEGILGSKPYDEAIHRDNLALIES